MSTVEQVKQIVVSLPFVYNKDCSEYAEDIQREAGGELYTYKVMQNEHKRRPIRVRNRFMKLEQCTYHTVNLIECDGRTYVADYFSPASVMLLEDYEEELNALNKEALLTGARLIRTKGYTP